MAWGRHPHVVGNLSPRVTIQGHGSDYLHVVFSDSDFDKTPVDAPVRYACVSTIERLRLETRMENTAPNLEVPDSFSNGDFEVEIAVTSEEGPYANSRFRIHVDTDYSRLTMTEITKWQRLKDNLSTTKQSAQKTLKWIKSKTKIRQMRMKLAQYFKKRQRA